MTSLPTSTPSRMRPTPYQPLALVAAAACLGVVIDRQLGSALGGRALAVWWLAAAGFVFAGCVTYRLQRAKTTTLLLLLAVAGNAAAWSRMRWSWYPHDDLGRFACEQAEPACVEAVLLDTPSITPPPPRDPLRPTPLGTISEANVRLAAIRDGRRWRSASGKARLRVVGELRDVSAGDQLRLFARLNRPMPMSNPGQYDWESAERIDRRLCELFCSDLACIEVVRPASPNRVTRALGALRQWCVQQISANIRWGDGKLPLAVLLGQRDQLPRATTDAFLNTGTIHLLVVSGLHVGMVAGLAWWLTSMASVALRWRVVATIVVALIYAAVVGASPPVIRAAALVVLFLLALASGRRTTPLNLLSAALAAVVVYNPAELFQSGTQLSFLSVFALMLLGQRTLRMRRVDPLQRLLTESAPWPRRLGRRMVASAVAMTLASLVVWLASLPLVAYHFNKVTPIGVIITPVVWPLVALALAAGLGAATIGWLVPPIATICGGLCGGGLHLTQQVVQWADSIELGCIHTAGPQTWWVCVWYAGFGLFSLMPAVRPGIPMLAGIACLWLAASPASDGWRQTRSDELRCTFLAVGHGTCVVLELPGGQTLLYDAGSLGSPRGAARIISSFLWSQRIDHIDALVISHADIDHYNAVPQLLQWMPIDVVYVSPMMFDPFATEGQLTAPNYLCDVLQASDVPMREIWMGDRLRTRADEVEIEVLHPPKKGILGDDNANSLLLSVSYAGRRILLPGDLEARGIDAVTADPPYDCDILLAPHHGSASSDPPGFAAWSTPEQVVLSGRRRPGTIDASATYQQAGARVWHTADAGAVMFLLSRDGGIETRPFRGGSPARD